MRRTATRLPIRGTRARRRVAASLRRFRHEQTASPLLREESLLCGTAGDVRVVYSSDPDLGFDRPAVLIVPGLGQCADDLSCWLSPFHAADLVQLGLTVAVVDLPGRGGSDGVEDFGGAASQDAVVRALEALEAREEVRPDRIGILSLSLGASATGPALCRSPVAVSWWIDWEGPSDREIITAGGKRLAPAAGHAMTSDAYWNAREPARWVGQTGVPYLRLQSQLDHAQPGETRHAERMLAAAATSELPWFQLVGHPRNEVPAEPSYLPPGDRALRAALRATLRELIQIP